jgi:hypothetical protein
LIKISRAHISASPEDRTSSQSSIPLNEGGHPPGTGSSYEGTAPSSLQLQQVLGQIACKAPTGPVGSKGLLGITQDIRPAWSVREDHGNLTVWLPSNLESSADDPLVIAVAKAIELLGQAQINFQVGLEGEIRDAKGTTKASLWAFGAAAALHDRHITGNPHYTGVFGKGYNWVIKKHFEQLNINTQYLTGGSASLFEVVTGTPWGNNVSGEVNRLIALIRRGAGALKINDPRPWLKSYEAFRSSFLKKDLKHQRVGILTQMEVDYLSITYPEADQAYVKFESDLANADLTFVANMQQNLNAVARATARVESIANDIIQLRVRALYPPQRGQRAKAKRTPIWELINAMDGPTYISCFNPALVAGKQKFTIPEHALEDLDQDLEGTHKFLIQQYTAYVHTIPNGSYRADCISWFEAAIAARLNK